MSMKLATFLSLAMVIGSVIIANNAKQFDAKPISAIDMMPDGTLVYKNLTKYDCNNAKMYIAACDPGLYKSDYDR